MFANVVIIALIATYSAYVIFKVVRDFKEGKSIGCTGCPSSLSCGGKCATCRNDVRKLKEFRRLKNQRKAEEG